jgi:outer membrane receptor protein involved in Fe transport
LLVIIPHESVCKAIFSCEELTMKPNHFTHSIALLRWRRNIARSCAAVAIALYAIPIQAQDSAEPNDAEVLEEIVVTGSRIPRTGFDTPSPVSIVGLEKIENASSPAIGDLLNQMPQLRSTFGLSNSQGFIGTAGIGRLDLRGLGTARTLVLVNGRRHVSSSEGTSAVDVNSLNPDMIERIEVITGANSAVYGADAVSGAINIITRKDFEGLRLKAEGGQSADDFGRESFSLLAGRNFDSDRGNATLALAYDSQDDLLVGDRGGRFTELWGMLTNPLDGDTIDANGIQVDDGIPDEIYVPNQGFWAISENGTSLALNGHINDDGSFAPVPFGAFEFTDGLECGGVGCTALDLDTFQMLQVPLQRFTIDFNVDYELTDDSSFYVEARYANLDATQQGQPSFDFGAPILIQRDNAFVSPSLAAAMDTAGATTIDIRRFNIDLGLRQEENNRETVRIVAGVEGDLGGSYSYDVFANYGRSSVERININNRIDERFAAAYDSIQIDAAQATALQNSGFIPDAQAGDIACRSTVQEAEGTVTGLPAFAYDGCVPLNVLGRGMASAESLAFINSTALGIAEIQQVQLQAVITNPDLAELWAGSLAGVVGVEFREEESFVRGDSLSALGNTFFNALSDTRGDYDVTELFTEFSLPLLSDRKGAQSLRFEAAGRYSDYSTIGDTVTWETRLSWVPIEDLRFRISAGEALRAPNIGDLFDPGGEDFTNVNDPCDMQNLDLGDAGRNVRIMNCQALGIADPENFDSLDESSITEFQGGNPDLGEETASTFTIGFVWSPSFIEGLRVAVDYWDIEIEDAIASTGSQTILDRCVDNPNGINNPFCELVTRDAIGNIIEMRQRPLNLNTLVTTGYDFEIGYGTDIGNLGSFDTSLVGSYLDERTFFLSSDNDVDVVEGELGDPEWQLNWRTTWSRNDWSAFAEVRWIDSMYIVSQELLFGSSTNIDPNPDTRDVTETGSQTYLDLGVNYAFTDKFSVGLTLDNALDEEPPFPLFGNDETVVADGAGALYDTIGRFVVLKASLEF